MFLRFRLRLPALILLFLSSLTLAYPQISEKPLAEPSLEKAILSECIVIAEYIDYTKDAEITYFRGPLARYKVIKVLKGEVPNGTIEVDYDFNDYSACIAPKDWRFSSDLMPQKGSRWILFLENKSKITSIYVTYRGNYGRQIANDKNIRKVNSLLKK